MNKRKPMPLQNLPDGSPFLLRSLSEDFIYMYLVRAGDSTCKVQGFKKTDAGNYSWFMDFFSPATEVFSDKSRDMLQRKKDGSFFTGKKNGIEEYEFNNLNEDDFNNKSKEEPTNKKTRKAARKMKVTDIQIKRTNAVGRPKKHSIVLPVGEEFTVCEIASKLGVDKFIVNNEIARIKKEKPHALKSVGVSSNGRGKPATVWKLV